MAQARTAPGLKRFRFPIARVEKLEDGRLLVEGTATSEAVVDGLILDYDAMKAAAEHNYKGNVREMHDHVAVGRAIEIVPNDETRTIGMRLFISSGAPNTQAKILDGTLQGLSVGVNPLEMKREKLAGRDVMRGTKIDWAETSVVDSGADPNTNDLAVVLCRGAHLQAALTGETEMKTDTSDVSVQDPADRFRKVMRAADKTDEKKTAEDAPAAGDDEKPPEEGSEEEKVKLAKEAAASPAVENVDDLVTESAKCAARMEYLKERAAALEAVDKLPEGMRSRRAAIERAVRIAQKLRCGGYYDQPYGDDEFSDLQMAIGIALQMGWLAKSIAALIAAEHDADEMGEPGAEAQMQSLHAALEHCHACCEAVKTFIGAEASELVAVEMEPVPAPSAPAESASADATAAASTGVSMVENARRATSRIAPALLLRRMSQLERTVSASMKTPPLSGVEGEAMALVIGERLGDVRRSVDKAIETSGSALTKAFGEFKDSIGVELKAVRGTVELMAAQPALGGPARAAYAAHAIERNDGKRKLSHLVEGMAERAPNGEMRAWIRNQAAALRIDGE